MSGHVHSQLYIASSAQAVCMCVCAYVSSSHLGSDLCLQRLHFAGQLSIGLLHALQHRISLSQ